MDFHNSITEQAMANVTDTWANELADSATWLEEETQERIFDFLNARENMCTAEFILRRHIQMHFPKILQRAADKAGLAQSDYADHSESGNVPWPIKLVEKLSTVIAAEKFDNISDLGLDSRQWKKILLGEAFCNRTSAIKIIFALNMDEATAAKFLIASGKNLFSTRNPFDYICEFCLKGNFTYDTAESMLAEFETSRKNFLDESAPNQSKEQMEFGTLLLKNETEKILNDDILRPEDKQSQLLKYMLEHEVEFVAKVERKNRRAEYSSGFSRQNGQNLKIFLSYLTELYPNFLQWKELNEFDPILISKAVQTNADGSPKNPEHLLQAIKDAQEIYLWEAEELEELGLPTGNERDANGKRQLKDKQRYDAIPFNAAILLPLKNLSVTLRSNLRGEQHPDNAEDVDRSTILFLTYFFICGCRAPGANLDELAERLDSAIDSEEDSRKNTLLYALKAVVNNVESIAYGDNPVELYVDSLNELLRCFNCNEFYAPFVIDKFILLCLLTLRQPRDDEDYQQYLINAIIEESYRLSKKILEGT